MSAPSSGVSRASWTPALSRRSHAAVRPLARWHGPDIPLISRWQERAEALAPAAWNPAAVTWKFPHALLSPPWGPDDEHRLLKDALEQVELADRLGIDYCWEVEHHLP
ncbi:MAG TPA: hypothetical protein VE776_12440 [Actinomycetota bacterium]|jgi:hypothetical protein|nr:hypothetical protein [Actinomycetota bacterium]